jgi:hypothetical protein
MSCYTFSKRVLKSSRNPVAASKTLGARWAILNKLDTQKTRARTLATNTHTHTHTYTLVASIQHLFVRYVSTYDLTLCDICLFVAASRSKGIL